MGIVRPVTQAPVSARFLMRQAVSSIVPAAEGLEIVGPCWQWTMYGESLSLFWIVGWWVRYSVGWLHPAHVGLLWTQTAQLGCGIGRVCPVIPPAGIVGCAALTLPDRRGVGDRERWGCCRRPPRLSTLYPRKPHSGEGMVELTCAASCLLGWRLARPSAALEYENIWKCKKEHEKSSKPFVLSWVHKHSFIFRPRAQVVPR